MRIKRDFSVLILATLKTWKTILLYEHTGPQWLCIELTAMTKINDLQRAECLGVYSVTCHLLYASEFSNRSMRF